MASRQPNVKKQPHASSDKTTTVSKRVENGGGVRTKNEDAAAITKSAVAPTVGQVEGAVLAGKGPAEKSAEALTNETPLKQCINVIEKKLRNLEKRKSKLDDYRALLASGSKLNNDQEEAIKKYDVVLQNLEFAKDLQKQFQAMSTDIEKQAKKTARREAIERQKEETGRMKDVLRLLNFLNSLGSEEARSELVSNKAMKVSEENLTQLDEFYQLINISPDENGSVEEQLGTASVHVMSYLDGVDKPVAGTTYKLLRELVQRASNPVVSNGHSDAAEIETATEAERKQPDATEAASAEQRTETEAFHGYPPRADYQPVGFQGYSDGFASAEESKEDGTVKQSSIDVPQHGGPALLTSAT